MTAVVNSRGVTTRGRPPRTQQQRAEQRARLIDGAMEAIRRFGPDASLVEIASVAGVSKPVLYSEFGDKQGVADAIAVTLAERLEAQMLDQLAYADAVDLGAVVTAVIGALIELIDGGPEVYGFLVRSLRNTDRGLLDNALVRVLHERSLFFAGLVTPNVNPEELKVVTDAGFGMVLGAVESWSVTKSLPKEALVARLSSAILAGLRDLVADSQ